MSSIQLDHAGRVHSLDGTVLNDQVNSSHPTPDTAGKYGVQVKVGAQRQTFQSGGPASQVTNASAQLMEPSRVGSSSPTVRLTDGRMVTPETAEVLRVQAPHLVPTEESVTANVDGNYDKRGLPDPLVLAFYFTVQGDLIVQLIILRNRFDI